MTALHAGPAVSIAPTLDITCAHGAVCDDVLLAAFARYTKILLGHGTRAAVGLREVNLPAGTSALSRVVVSVKSKSTVLNATSMAEMTESYTLHVPSNGEATIDADSTLGALRGLETFAQLVDFGLKTAAIASTPVHVVDAPRFPWRGLRLDSSRHYLPMGTILAAIDTMASVKLNVMMWHIVDGNSVPLQSELYPELSEKGAYCKECIYTQDDVRKVVEFARMRGVRVQPEVDVPGHSGFGYGKPALVACPTFEAFRGGGRALDVTSDATYVFLKAYMLETAELFPEPVFNFCGDELQCACLQSNPKIVAWMKQRNMSCFQTEQHFWQRMNEKGGVVEALAATGKQFVVAEGSSVKQGSVNASVFPGSPIAEIWGKEAVSVGLHHVLSTYPKARAILGGPYYLDVQSPWQQGDRGAPGTHYGWMDTWMDFYHAEPFSDGNLTKEEQSRILGGMAEQWSEQVDASSIESRMWPRALAVAERLWSSRKLTINNFTVPRLQRASCQVLERRGVRGGPIEPGFCPWSLGWKTDDDPPGMRYI